MRFPIDLAGREPPAIARMRRYHLPMLPVGATSGGGPTPATAPAGGA